MIGESTGTRVEETCRRLGWGRMWVHRKIRLLPGEKWGFDNGAFPAWVRGEKWDADAWLTRMKAARQLGQPYLAVLPDLPARGLESLAFSLDWYPRLPPWPWYLAVQDGMRPEDVEPVIHRFAGLFLGGSNRFKATAPEWLELAHRHQRKLHYARCSSVRKLHWCQEAGVDSADSSQPLWGWERFDRFVRAFEGPTQTELFLRETFT